MVAAASKESRTGARQSVDVFVDSFQYNDQVSDCRRGWIVTCVCIVSRWGGVGESWCLEAV